MSGMVDRLISRQAGMPVLLLFLTLGALEAECISAGLELGAVVEGTLTAADCKAQEFLPDSSTADIPGIRPLTAQVYTVNVEQAGVLRLRMASASFPPLVVLVNEKREVLQYVEGLTTAAAELLRSVTAGKYTVVALTRTAAVGAYSLQASLEERRACAPPDLTFDQVLNGSLTAEDCRGLDVVTQSSNERPVDVYRIAVEVHSVYAVAAASNAFFPVLAVVNAKTGVVVNDGQDSNNGTQAQIVLSLPEGEYLLVVTSGGAGAVGAYAMRAAKEVGRTCPVEALGAGSVRGALTTSDCRLLDFVPFSSNFSFIRAYSLELAAKSVVTLDQISTQFDSYLNLLREDKSFLAEDDDSGGAGNSRIAVMLRPGKYTVLANAYEEGAIGAFELRAAVAAPRECPVGDLPVSGTVNSEVATSDCPVREMIEEEPAGNPARQFRLTLEEAGTVTLEMTSAAFAPGLVLLDAEGKLRSLGLQQVRAGTIRGSAALTTGSYTVIAYSGNLRLGAFSITSSVVR